MIGVCSFGCTGSGAVLDLLKEYNGVTVRDGKEFVITYFPDGVEDLEYKLMKQKAKFFSSDIAINRFIKYMKSICHNDKSYYFVLTNGNFDRIVKEYIDGITQIQWKGRWMYDEYMFNSFIDKLFFVIKNKTPFLKKYTLRNMYYSINPDSFYKETERFLKNIYNFDNSKDVFILDQPFPANNPKNSMRLYGDDSKAIIVLRDPRDVFLMFKEHYSDYQYTWSPVVDVDYFIKFYKRMYYKEKDNENIMYIYFEDLIFNYEETVTKIEKFCGLSKNNHFNKLNYFNPKKSLRNTKLFMKNDNYANEIKEIEEKMSDYLYDFSKTTEIDYSTEIF